MGSGDNGAGLMRKQQQNQQAQIGLATDRINNTFAAFDPSWYQKAQSVFLKQSMPGVQSQAQNAEKGLGFSLANRGLTTSSSAQQLGEGLSKDVNSMKQGAVNQATGETNQLRTMMGQKEASLVSEANAANSPLGTAQKAVSDAQQFQAPEWMSAIGAAIGGWANGFTNLQKQNAANAAWQQNQQRDFGGPPANVGYDTGNMKSVSTVA